MTNSTLTLFDKESMIIKIQESSRSSTMFQNVLLAFLLTAFLLFVLCVVLTGVLSEKRICCKLCGHRHGNQRNSQQAITAKYSSSSDPSISHWGTVDSGLSLFNESLLGLRIDAFLENGIITETGNVTKQLKFIQTLILTKKTMCNHGLSLVK